MALLSGASSSPAVFLREYLTVASNSTSAVLAGETGPVRGETATIRQRFDSLIGLGQKSVEKARLVFRDVRQELLRASA